MPTKPDLGDFLTSNNEFNSNVTITIGNTTVNVLANSTVFGVSNPTNASTINSTSFSGIANNTLYVGSVTAVNVVSNAQLQANLVAISGQLNVPSGTKMLFVQTAAPTTWTKDTTNNNKALRVVSGTISSGGTVAFSTLFGRTSTDNFTITSVSLPSFTCSHSLTISNHRHAVAIYDSFQGALAGTTYDNDWRDSKTSELTNSVSLGVSGSVTYSGSGSGHSHGLDMRLQYVDIIFATKD